MLTMDQIHHIRDLYYNQGLTMEEVADKVGCNWKTVRKYVDQEDFSQPKPKPEKEQMHESKLDEYKPIIDHGDGTFSMESGIYLRHYDGYSEDAQQFLSVLDACYSMIASYSEIIDPYINGEKSFDDDQWNVIETEVRYMSGYSCSWAMQNEVPEELSGHSEEIFYSAYHLLIANDLLLTAVRIDDAEAAALASYFFSQADKGLEWLNR